MAMKTEKKKRVKKGSGLTRTHSTTRRASSSRAERRRQRPKHKKKISDPFKVIKKSLSDIGRSFSEGADNIADILIDKRQKTKGAKARRLKKELASTVNDIALGIKRSLKKLNPKDVLCKSCCELGKLSRITRDTSVKIFNDLME